jgi:hypothetical protein
MPMKFLSISLTQSALTLMYAYLLIEKLNKIDNIIAEPTELESTLILFSHG